MKKLFPVLLSVGIAGGAFAAGNPTAIIHTTEGDITVELYPDKAPETVANFIGLSTGKKTWTDPASNEVVNGRPLYNGTIFHRVIPGFMVQGGDPLGKGFGGPGYRFKDEISDLKFDKPGYLAMANSGPGTNGSQFFITVVPTQHLTGKHTIFGYVTKGMDVINKIISKPTAPGDRPLDPPSIKSIDIIEAKGAAPAAADKATTATKAADPKTTGGK